MTNIWVAAADSNLARVQVSPVYPSVHCLIHTLEYECKSPPPTPRPRPTTDLPHPAVSAIQPDPFTYTPM